MFERLRAFPSLGRHSTLLSARSAPDGIGAVHLVEITRVNALESFRENEETAKSRLPYCKINFTSAVISSFFWHS